MGNCLIWDETNAVDNHGNMGLHIACQSGDDKRVAYLIERKADVNARNNCGETPLHKCVRSEKCVELLVENKADLEAKNIFGNTPLHYGFAIEKCAAIVIENKADINARNNNGDTPLHCNYLNVKCAALLINGKADVNARNKYGATPIHYNLSDNERFALLIENKADINIQREDGRTVLHNACIYNDDKHVRLLLSVGVNIFIKNSDGKLAKDLTDDVAIRRMIYNAENHIRQIRRTAILVMWYRANYFHEYRHSGLPLVNEIMKYL